MEVKLIMFRANGQRKDFPVVGKRTVIGRGENCDLRIPLLSVSRQHCELSAVGGLRARDLASSNGTFVNNERINETELSPGDRLVVGPVVFTVQINGVPGDIEPVKTRGQRIAEQSGTDSAQLGEFDEDVISQPGASGVNTLPFENIDDEEADYDAIDPLDALESLARQDEDRDRPSA